MGRKFSRQKFDVKQAQGWPTLPPEVAEVLRQEREGKAARAAEVAVEEKAGAEPERVVSPYGQASIIVGVCSLFIASFLLGPAAIILGALALGHGDNRGLWGILLGIAGPALCLLIGAALLAFMFGSGVLFGL